MRHQVWASTIRSKSGPTAWRIRRTVSTVLLRPQGRPHFVRAETQLGDGRGLGGVAFRRHVHARAAVEADAVAHAPADQLRNRHAAAACRPGRRARSPPSSRPWPAPGRRPAPPERARAEASGSASARSTRNGRDHLFDGLLRRFASRPGRVPDQPVIGFHADQHGIALENGALAAPKRQADRLGERVGKQIGADAGDPHDDAPSG